MILRGILTQRRIQWLLIFVGCAVHYMIITVLFIAIIPMNQSANSTMNGNNKSHNQQTDGNLNTITEYEDIFEDVHKWNSRQEADILGSFFWTYWISQLWGGFLTQTFGTKFIFGISNLFMSFITFFIPLASKTNINSLICVRMLQGFVGGISWPSLHYLVARWTPPNSRSIFVTAYTGTSLGAAINYFLSGYIIQKANWDTMFYITATIGLVWFVAWQAFIYDAPEDDPHYSERVMFHTESTEAEHTSPRTFSIPWLKLATPGPLWVLIFAHWGCLYGVFTLLIEAPAYFQSIHGWKPDKIGIMSGIPHILRIIFSFLIAYASDFWLKINNSPTTVRKIAISIACVTQGAILFGLSLCDNRSTTALILFITALTASGAEVAGPLASYFDLSPNFASVTLGIGYMVATMPLFLLPRVTGMVSYDNPTESQWTSLFLTSSVMTGLPGLLYLVCGSSKLQEWDSPHESDAEEMQTLHM